MVPNIQSLHWSVNNRDHQDSNNYLHSPLDYQNHHNGSLPSIESTLNQINNEHKSDNRLPKLPSIHFLTKNDINNTIHYPPPLPQHQTNSSIHSFQPTLASPLQFRSNVNNQAIQHPVMYHKNDVNQNQYAHNSPTSPVSPILSPYLNNQQKFSSYSPPQHNNVPHPQQTYGSYSLSSSTPPLYENQIKPNFQQSPIIKSEPKTKKKRKTTKSSNNNMNANIKFRSKPDSTKNRRKPKQNLIIDTKNIHYPIHHLESPNVNHVPESILNQFNTSIYPKIDTKKYSTSAIDQNRNYLTVYEYNINDHWVIWDYETGFVHLTGIWKASLNVKNSETNSSQNENHSANHLKADIVKLLESTPKDYQFYIKRIRGGFLKIQGTWLPYKLCKILARRFCYYIRFELIPIFGNDFPESCLKPNEKGFGELKLNDLENFKQEELPEPAPLPIEVNQPSQEQQQQTEKSFVNQAKSGQQNHPKYHQNNVEEPAVLVPPANLNQERNQSVPSMGTFIPLPQPEAIKISRPFGFNEGLQLQSPMSYHKYSSSNSSDTSLNSSVFSRSNYGDGNHSIQMPMTPMTAVQDTKDFEKSNSSSYADLLDIVNASKCLQSLSQEPPIQPINRKRKFMSIGSLPKPNHQNDEDQTDLEDESNSNYTTILPSIKNQIPDDNGISSILIAAELNSQKDQQQVQFPQQKTFNQKQNTSSIRERPSMRVGDLAA
ncbi:hypothetical protein KGF54_004931 [Candida jiufengensis]|uniref:uncharacterized protein n=1 Tax=Candida jiufengensis TaxID=497108 RepID=UPI0022256817|nr:uncharacterized protein KGF54_004931 [Candida jiufengensis]KAI5951856.1 hypothetical protein KGF54_004931 [Candida jiufengensis]